MTTSSASLFNGKHAVTALLLTLVPMLPSLLLAPLGWGEMSGPFVLATMAGLMAAVFGSARLALIVVAGLAVADMLALPAAPSPWWAGLVMGTAALLYGLSARRGLAAMVVTAPVGVAFIIADPPRMDQGSMLRDSAALGLFVLLGGLWGTAFGRFLGRKLPRKVPSLSSWVTAVLFGVTIAVATGVTMGLVVAYGVGHTGAWIAMTLLLVLQPRLHDTFQRSVERALGTALGFGVVLAIGLVVSDSTVLLALGLLLLTLAVYVKLDPRSKYWQFTTFITPGIVLAEGSNSNVTSMDVDRLWASLAGVAIALVLLGIFRLLGVLDKKLKREADSTAP